MVVEEISINRGFLMEAVVAEIVEGALAMAVALEMGDSIEVVGIVETIQITVTSRGTYKEHLRVQHKIWCFPLLKLLRRQFRNQLSRVNLWVELLKWWNRV